MCAISYSIYTLFKIFLKKKKERKGKGGPTCHLVKEFHYTRCKSASCPPLRAHSEELSSSRARHGKKTASLRPLVNTCSHRQVTAHNLHPRWGSSAVSTNMFLWQDAFSPSSSLQPGTQGKTLETNTGSGFVSLVVGQQNRPLSRALRPVTRWFLFFSHPNGPICCCVCWQKQMRVSFPMCFYAFKLEYNVIADVEFSLGRLNYRERMKSAARSHHTHAVMHISRR